ncbi:serine/threonine-protein kinase [Streptomyces gamaensis]|uniref:non-specific serine/threonine protein kinase n=1 Tax=Streptomyces gamaensis TaxID=1763542 RepID=A0ABW0Z7U4_9ACTN
METFAAHDGLIAGRYRLDRRIGRGGMGTVWRATDELLSREVAVKELHMGEGTLPGLCAADTRSERARMLREARAAALIKHPNVVVLHDIVEQDGRPWIVMELVDGRALSVVLAADGPLAAPEAARIALALLSALRAAHARGVLHRDIKPPNVLLESATGRVVLTDFGIAQVTGATTITETGAFVGSPEYTAPERISGGRTGPACDLWSLGVLLCAALSGHTPFRRDSLGGTLNAVVQEELRLPAEAQPLLPVVRGLLERDPAHRMGADEAERLLRTYLATGRVPDRARAGRTRRWPALRGAGRGPGPSVLPGGPGRPRTALTAAVAVVTLAGMGAGLAALLSGGGGWTEGRSGAASRPLEPPGPEPPASAAVDAPPGYHPVQDPVGFALAVPDGYTRSFEPPRVYYSSPDRGIRLGVLVQDPVKDGPYGALRGAASQAPGTYPGYRAAGLARTAHRQFPAASWEFTWNGPDGAAVRSYDVAWDEAGRMYDVSVSGPAGRAQEIRRHLDTALDGFARIKPVSSP